MRIILLLSIFLLFANCSSKQAVKLHGVHKLEIKQIKITENKTNRNDIIKILGPPSTVSYFDNEILFFIERKVASGSILKLGKRKIIVNNVLILEIDKYGILNKKNFYDLTKMKEIKFTKVITDVDYSKESYIYDFLSSMRQKINDPLGKRR